MPLPMSPGGMPGPNYMRMSSTMGLSPTTSFHWQPQPGLSPRASYQQLGGMGGMQGPLAMPPPAAGNMSMSIGAPPAMQFPMGMQLPPGMHLPPWLQSLVPSFLAAGQAGMGRPPMPPPPQFQGMSAGGAPLSGRGGPGAGSSSGGSSSGNGSGSRSSSDGSAASTTPSVREERRLKEEEEKKKREEEEEAQRKKEEEEEKRKLPEGPPVTDLGPMLFGR